MGKEHEENPVKDLETLLGLSDDEGDEHQDIDEGDDHNGDELDIDGDVDTKNNTPAVDTSAVSVDALIEHKAATTKEIAKIEVKIEELKSKSVDTESFYDNLETHLSEEEQALEFEDKSAYMKLIAKKAKEFEEKHSPATEVSALEAQKIELEKVLARQNAITSVIAKYPTFDYEKVMEFFDNKLSKEQQQSIYNQSQSYEDVYEKTFVLFAESNKMNIKSQKPPQYPNVNTARKQAASNKEIDDGMSSDDQKLANALGL